MTIIPAEQVQRLVMPDAWAYHEDLDDPLDVDALLSDVGGNTRLAAATILEYVAGLKDVQSAGQSAALKSFNVSGEYSEEYFQGTSPTQATAALWRARAAALRADVQRSGRLPRTPSFVSVRMEPG